MRYRNELRAVYVLLVILLITPLYSLADPAYITVTTKETSNNGSSPDNLSGSVVTISTSGSSEKVTYGIAQAIGTGTENLVIVKIYNVYEISDSDTLGMMQMLLPGEDRYFSDLIVPGQTRQYVRVSWDESSALNLTIYTPDGAYGPYPDEADGKNDHTIFLKFAVSDGLDPGRWYYQVSGDRPQVPVPFLIETWRE